MNPSRRRTLMHLPNVFQTDRCRIDKYRNCFFPDAIILWNNFIRTISKLWNYFNIISSLIRPQPAIFSIHNPKFTRIIFQLRVGLSPLKHHKRTHNFLDTPSDTCSCLSGVEDTHHFFLVCSIFSTQRQFLDDKVEEILRS